MILPWGKHRVVTLADELIPALRQQITLVQQFLDADIVNPGYAGVYLPHRLRLKYQNASRSLQWQYLFASRQLSKDPEDSSLRRHHIDESAIQKAIRFAARKAKIGKTVTPHTLRHSVIKCVLAFYPSGHPADVQI